MAAKSTTNRKVTNKRTTAPRRVRPQSLDVDEMNQDEDREEEGYLAHTASQAAEYAREHQGRVVLTALVTGFSVGLFLGGLLAHSKKQETWSDRLAAEGLGKRLMERVDSLLPHIVAKRLGRG